MTSRQVSRQVLAETGLTGAATRESDHSPLDAGQWLTVTARGDGIEYRIPKGSLTSFNWLTADFLLDGDQQAVLIVRLAESDTGRVFGLTFAMLNQCQARLRLPLSAVDQNQWMLGREGALLKRLCVGSRVELSAVDRMELSLERHGPKPTRLCMTPLCATVDEPEPLTQPLLPVGPLVDAIGQSTLHEWPAKTPSGVLLHQRLKQQLADVPAAQWPESFSKWGGWRDRQFEAAGYFRTHHDGRRWWLVDPDGHPFWSAGPDCVSMNIESAISGIESAARWLPTHDKSFFAQAWSPRHPACVNFLVTNFMRVFAEQWHERWATITLSMLKRIGFNTVANWSDWKIAQAAGFPYVRPMEFRPKRTTCIYRDFPDIFADTMAQDAADYAEQLREHAGDRAFIGYFLMNEPTWGFASETPAEGMLYNTESCRCRDELAQRLQARYGSDDQLAQAWGMPVTFESVRRGRWHGRITDACRVDLEWFATVMVDHYFRMLSWACKRVDPNHINLGARYYTVPPRWALEGMKSFDVFSINCYRQRVPADQLDLISQATGRPTLIGEWHFGALDVGLPASGIGLVRSQEDRGRAYRVYVEQAAALPNCVGVHWFTLYDQSALGRFDGENYNIGFLDVCNRPYEELCAAALASHQRMYAIAAGEIAPTNDAPDYLPPLFM